MPQRREVDRSSPVPAYHQIYEDLCRRIADVEWKEGQRLPSEKALAGQYSASRVTVRLALDALERGSLIRKVRGSGSVVLPQEEAFCHSFSLPATLCEKLGHKGISLDAETSIFELRDAASPITDLLRLGGPSRVVYLKRLFRQSSRPLALSESWIAESLVPGLPGKGLIEGHLSNTLAMRYGLAPVRIENTLEVARLNVTDSGILDALLDAPAIAVSSVSFLPFDLPLEYSRTLWLADRVRFRFNLDNSGLT